MSLKSNTPLTLKTMKKRRLLVFLAIILTILIIPSIVIIIKFNLIEQFKTTTPKTQFSILAMISLIVVFLIFYKKINLLINQMEFSILKVILNGFMFMIPLTIFLVIFIGLTFVLEDVIFVFKWIWGCAFITSFTLIPIWSYYNTKIAKENRVLEVRKGTEAALYPNGKGV
jgi:hypothetical protein